jgi:hypothetical protein
MYFNIHDKSSELLEKLANSIFDRDTQNPNPLFFSVKEVQIVEDWIKEFIHEEDFI